MKKQFAIIVFALLAVAAYAPRASAQASVKGVVKDAEGKPIANAIVLYSNQDNGTKYTLKTNAKGEYFSLGITIGKYNVILYRTADDQAAGKEADRQNNFPVQMGENNLDLDMKAAIETQAKSAGMTAEQMKAKEDERGKAIKENASIKTLNEKLVAAKAAAEATPPDYETAIGLMKDATQVDPNRDLIWFKLGDYYRLSATKQTDPAEKQKRLDSAVESYQKAVELKKAAPPDKDTAKDAQLLAAYYNNLADALAKDKKVDDAAKTYELAAKADPTTAAGAYFNEGAILTNAGRPDDANAAFDRSIAADPNRAEAYYQKGVNLLGKMTIQGTKQVPAPGTVEALQKYLELAPNGPNAQSAKDLLTSLGSPIETTFGTGKKKKN